MPRSARVTVGDNGAAEPPYSRGFVDQNRVADHPNCAVSGCGVQLIDYIDGCPEI